MTAPRDPDRLIHRFLLEGEEHLADQVYDAVRAEIDQKRQRVVIGPWRTPTMNRIVGFGLAAAAVVAVVLIGSQLIASPTNVGGPGVEPTLTTEPSVVEPTPSPTPAGLLPEGSHVLWEGGITSGVPMTVTIPAPDWYGQPGDGILVKHDQSGAPDGGGMIVFPGDGDFYVYGDPCDWSATRPDLPATTVDEFVTAIAAQASRDASAPVDATVDGYAGKSITLHVPENAIFSECDQGTFGSWTMRGADLGPDRYHQDPGQIDKLWILDVNGELVVIDIAYYPGTPQAVIDELEAIVESTTFD